MLEADKERRRLRLGIKQLEPTSIDEYIAEHKAGDTVSGRIVEVSGPRAKVELGEGVVAQAKLPEPKAQEAPASSSKADLSALSAMLAAKWKSGPGAEPAAEGPRAGQIRSFRILSIDPATKKIELEML